MREIRFTLVSDGSSDRALLPILKWAMIQATEDCAVQEEWAGPWRTRASTQPEAIRKAVEYYPCDILFVHRDAESKERHLRVEEIKRLITESGIGALPAICVVPVRMTEAWLLTDEGAIRHAAGNPSGTVKLEIPADAEAIPDPKRVLYGLLTEASELHGRRRKKFRPEVSAIQIPQRMSDFTRLRKLSAFVAFEEELAAVLAEHGYLPEGATGKASCTE